MQGNINIHQMTIILYKQKTINKNLKIKSKKKNISKKPFFFQKKKFLGFFFNVLFMSYSTLGEVSKLVPNLEYLFSFNLQLKSAATKFCFLRHLHAIKVPILKECHFGRVKLWDVEHFWTLFVSIFGLDC